MMAAIVMGGLAVSGIAYGQNEAWRRMLAANQAEQAVWIKTYLDRGMPIVEPDSSTLTMLILNRSSVALPLIETRIEEILRSSTPSQYFIDKSVDPQKFVDLAAGSISGAGDIEAIRQLGKLLRINEQRFGRLIDHTLVTARGYRNPFTVAYQGFQLSDPVVDARITAWAEFQLSEVRLPLRSGGKRDPEPAPQSEIQRIRRLWAEAMVDKYGRAPTENDWATDPIVSRLKTARTPSLHDAVMRAAAAVAESRSKGK